VSTLREVAARTDLPMDPAVVAPWRIGGGPRGALLLHGFAGTPPELRRLGERLAALGWRCEGPLLAGHGTTPEDLERTRWTDWVATARQALDRLRAECTTVAVAGQSAGGAIALHLAATTPDIAAAACLATPVWLAGLGPRVLPVARHLHRWDRPHGEVDLYRLEGIDELWSYGRRSTASIVQLIHLIATVRDELVCVRAPTLVLHGERDRVIHPDNAREIERRLLCARAVRRRLFPRSGHGLSVDIDRDEVEGEVVAWFDAHCPPPDASGPAPVAAGAARSSG
jgi:carboxylesterase